MKSIKTLVQDIYNRVSSNEPFQKSDVVAFGENLAAKLANRLSEERGENSLRLSNLGSVCGRKLWYFINEPESAEPLPPAARLKFLFGDILEELLLFLARAAGHRVEAEQERVDVCGVVGHIDGIIDGHLVDAKSASTAGFAKFRDHNLRDDDPFGYLTQLGGYLEGTKEDVRLQDKKLASFLAIDKQLGHIALDTYSFTNGENYAKLVEERKTMLAGPIPERAFTDEPQGHGNRSLGLTCSYCEFKQRCWPGLRTFAYSSGPKYFTVVVKQPYNKNGPIREIKEPGGV